MSLRFPEVVGTAGSDNLGLTEFGAPSQVYFGLQGADALSGNNNIRTADTHYSFFFGGDGGDTYTAQFQSVMIIADQGQGGSDTVDTRNPTDFMMHALIVDGRHLALFDFSSTTMTVVIDYAAPENTIETYILNNGIRYTEAEVLALMATSPGFSLGAWSWEQVSSAYGQTWSTAEMNEVLAFYSNRATALLPLTLAGGPAADLIQGNAGDDQLSAGAGNDTVQGGDGNDYVSGESGDDSLIGGAGQDWLWAGIGNDSLDGGAEKDNLNGEAGDDTIDGGAGNDRITGKDGNDVIRAGDGNDWVGVWNDWGEAPELNYFPEDGDDRIDGEAGDDVLSAGFGQDTVEGGTGNDHLAGEQGDDALHGADGRDWLWGGAGNDTLDGGAEKDNLNGEAGSDYLWGRDGADRLCGEQGDDFIYAGAGNDWVGVWNDWGEDPALNYFPEAGNDLIFGEDGDDVLSGGFGRDAVDGGAGNDYVAGEQDDDALSGGDGHDWLWAGSGNDWLFGGAGADTLIGETGADSFYFNVFEEFADWIVDFDGTEGDRFVVSSLLNLAGYLGNSPFEDGRATRAQDGSDVLISVDSHLIATLQNTTLAELQDSFFT